MDKKFKQDRYNRIYAQLEELLTKCDYHISRMATVVAVFALEI